MHFGFAPTETIRQVRPSRTVTAAAAVVPDAMRPGMPVNYHGSRIPDHGTWILDGPCGCERRCGGFRIWRCREGNLYRLVHVSPASVTAVTRP